MQALARFALRHTKLTLAAIAVLSLLATLGALRLRADAGFRAYVGARHPAVQELDDFVDRFGGGIVAAAVWRCSGDEGKRSPSPCSNVFDDVALAMAADVASQLERVPGVLGVESPATSPLIMSDEQGLAVRRLFESGVVAADRDRLAAQALGDPLWTGRLISSDGRVGAIVVDLASSESQVNVSVMHGLESALAAHKARGFEFHLVGDPVEFVVAGRDLRRDTFRLVPAIVVLIAGILFLLFRSVFLVLAALGSVGIAVLFAFGVMGLAGWPETAVTQALAPFILVVGVCDTVHLLASLVGRPHRSERASTPTSTREEAILAAVADVGVACAIASLTTAAGFLSFASSGAVSFVRFGVIAAVGVMSALLLTFTLLPILLRAAPSFAHSPLNSKRWHSALSGLVRVSQGRSVLVLTLSAALALVCMLGIGRLRADVDVEHLFGESSSVVRWIRFVETNLRPTTTLEVALTPPPGQSAVDPSVVARVDAVASSLSKVRGLDQAESAVDILARLNRLLRGEAPGRAGSTAEANAELLLLAELHAPQLLSSWVSLDQRSLRISVPVTAQSHSKAEGILAEVRSRLQRDLPADWEYSITGPLSAAYHMVTEVQRTQLRSFATAALVVGAIVAFFLRSVGWGLLAMLPNLLPVVVCLGAMGLWDIYLDMGTAMVAAVVMGIAVDDTLHLLWQYRRRLDAGADPEHALRSAVLHVGRAVVTTSFALAGGLFVLTLSSWASVASFGLLCGVAILMALVADLLVLPALISSALRREARIAAEVAQ